MKAITSILAILALAATVSAAEGDKKPEAGKKKAPPTPEQRLKMLDKDNNGSVSKEEYMASPAAKKDATKAGEQFTRMDKNGDGSLSLEELTPKKKKDA